MSLIHTRRGFTLIELLVVVLIIGILSAVALPQYQKAVARARATQLLTMIQTYQKAIDLYILEHDYQNVTFLGTGNTTSPLVALDVSYPADKAMELISYYNGTGGMAPWHCTTSMCEFQMTGGEGAKILDTLVIQRFATSQEWWGIVCRANGNLEGEIACDVLNKVYPTPN